MTRPIFFLTDFGLVDTYVGVVKAVILGIAPDATVVDLTHDVPPQDVRAGAFALVTAAPYLPDEAVVLAVVDPGVGTARRPIAVQAAGRTFVGPDNGLLSWAVRAPLTPQPSLSCAGEGEHVVVLDRPRFWRLSLSATFHGRDLFGPVAAHLARGVPLEEVGTPAATMHELPWPAARTVTGAGDGIVEAHGEVIHVDRYGNLITSLRGDDLPAQPVVSLAGQSIVGLSPHYQSPASGSRPLIALVGSSGLLEIAVPNGSATTALQAGVGTPVAVTSGQ